ncbi:hypothetical protein F5Y01DRAFT_184749 [Xylaria sp. FL0043]|nr:hypothetical protein F5Y01DRAFT_184749 [Xylaria sp. FL0043]
MGPFIWAILIKCLFLYIFFHLLLVAMTCPTHLYSVKLDFRNCSRSLCVLAPHSVTRDIVRSLAMWHKPATLRICPIMLPERVAVRVSGFSLSLTSYSISLLPATLSLLCLRLSGEVYLYARLVDIMCYTGLNYLMRSR